MKDGATRTLELWLRKLTLTKGKSPDQLVLRHCALGGKTGQVVIDVDVDKQLVGDSDWIRQTAGSLAESAEEDAEALGGVQTYVVFATSDGADKPLARKTFRISVDDDEDGDIASEPATKTGIVAQMMRHNEALHKMSVGSVELVVRNMTKTIEAISAQNEKLSEDRAAVFELMETLTTAAHEREIESRKADAKIAAMNKVADSVKLLLPVVASKALGVGVGNGSDGGNNVAVGQAQGAAIKALVDSLEPTQFAKLGEILTQEQLSIVLTLAQDAN